MVFEKFSGVLVHPNTMATPYSLLDEIRTIAGDNANAVHRIDMETSALFTVGGIHGIKCGSIMSVSDNPIAGKHLFNSITKKEVFEGLDLAVSVGLEALSRISI